MKDWEKNAVTLLQQHNAISYSSCYPTIGGRADKTLASEVKESVYLKAFVADPIKFLESHNTFDSLAGYDTLIDDQLTKAEWNNILTSSVPGANIANGTFTVDMKNNKS